MPKSRRDKVVALTQTKKKGRERKGGLIESVREALEVNPEP
jgi:mRNA turnover protein 4